jgi:hypothetical protein
MSANVLKCDRSMGSSWSCPPARDRASRLRVCLSASGCLLSGCGAVRLGGEARPRPSKHQGNESANRGTSTRQEPYIAPTASNSTIIMMSSDDTVQCSTKYKYNTGDNHGVHDQPVPSLLRPLFLSQPISDQLYTAN